MTKIPENCETYEVDIEIKFGGKFDTELDRVGTCYKLYAKNYSSVEDAISGCLESYAKDILNGDIV